jgi:DNA-binding response OmpR family regulator
LLNCWRASRLFCGDAPHRRGTSWKWAISASTGRRAERAGRVIELTAKEFALLEFLALHAGQVLSRATIAEHVWDNGYDARSNVIDVIVGRLRRKLEADGVGRLIHTVGGVGYTLRPG